VVAQLESGPPNESTPGFRIRKLSLLTSALSPRDRAGRPYGTHNPRRNRRPKWRARTGTGEIHASRPRRLRRFLAGAHL